MVTITKWLCFLPWISSTSSWKMLILLGHFNIQNDSCAWHLWSILNSTICTSFINDHELKLFTKIRNNSSLPLFCLHFYHAKETNWHAHSNEGKVYDDVLYIDPSGDKCLPKTYSMCFSHIHIHAHRFLI